MPETLRVVKGGSTPQKKNGIPHLARHIPWKPIHGDGQLTSIDALAGTLLAFMQITDALLGQGRSNQSHQGFSASTWAQFQDLYDWNDIRELYDWVGGVEKVSELLEKFGGSAGNDDADATRPVREATASSTSQPSLKRRCVSPRLPSRSPSLFVRDSNSSAPTGVESVDEATANPAPQPVMKRQRLNPRPSRSPSVTVRDSSSSTPLETVRPPPIRAWVNKNAGAYMLARLGFDDDTPAPPPGNNASFTLDILPILVRYGYNKRSTGVDAFGVQAGNQIIPVNGAKAAAILLTLYKECLAVRPKATLKDLLVVLGMDPRAALTFDQPLLLADRMDNNNSKAFKGCKSITSLGGDELSRLVREHLDELMNTNFAKPLAVAPIPESMVPSDFPTHMRPIANEIRLTRAGVPKVVQSGYLASGVPYVFDGSIRLDSEELDGEFDEDAEDNSE